MCRHTAERGGGETRREKRGDERAGASSTADRRQAQFSIRRPQPGDQAPDPPLSVDHNDEREQASQAVFIRYAWLASKEAVGVAAGRWALCAFLGC